MTRTQNVTYGLFRHAVLLLIAYALVSLLAAVKFLGDDPLATTLPFHQVNGFANVLLQLAILSGLLGGGLYAAASGRTDNRVYDERALFSLYRAWTVTVILSALAGIAGLLEGRANLELPPLLDVIVVVLVTLIAAITVRAVPRPRTVTSVVPIWALGMGLVVVGMVVGLIPPADYLQDRMLRALALGLMHFMGFPVAAVALGFWLMHRFSNVTPRWAQMGVNTVTGLVALAGALLTASSFQTIIDNGVLHGLSTVGVGLIPLIYAIFAAHSYRAFTDRNTNMTLAAQWLGLGVVLLLLSGGILGGLMALPSVYDVAAGTRLSDAQATLMQLGVIAVLLGVFNQASAELRSENRRVTGLVPFWLTGFGAMGGGLALVAAGIVQVYLERLLSVGYLETQTLLIPLYTLWFIGLVLLAAGVVTYALGFWARRPQSHGSLK